MKTTSVFLIAAFLAGCRGHTIVRYTPALPTLPAEPKIITAGEPAPVAAREGKIAEPAPESLPAAEEMPPVIHSLEELLLGLNDAFFDLDQHDLRPDARIALRDDASSLKTIAAQAPGTALVIEGHCDERGSAEYNMALGAMRADRAKEFLVELGVSASALRTTTYGKERPQCTAENEDCWQKNRRAHLAAEN